MNQKENPPKTNTNVNLLKKSFYICKLGFIWIIEQKIDSIFPKRYSENILVMLLDYCQRLGGGVKTKIPLVGDREALSVWSKNR